MDTDVPILLMLLNTCLYISHHLDVPIPWKHNLSVSLESYGRNL